MTVTNREVALSGTVDSREAKRRAEDIAESVGGVTHVQNNLRVGQGLSGGTDRCDRDRHDDRRWHRWRWHGQQRRQGRRRQGRRRHNDGNHHRDRQDDGDRDGKDNGRDPVRTLSAGLVFSRRRPTKPSKHKHLSVKRIERCGSTVR